MNPPHFTEEPHPDKILKLRPKITCGNPDLLTVRQFLQRLIPAWGSSVSKWCECYDKDDEVRPFFDFEQTFAAKPPEQEIQLLHLDNLNLIATALRCPRDAIVHASRHRFISVTIPPTNRVRREYKVSLRYFVQGIRVQVPPSIYILYYLY
jgi:hypothetical protein